LCLFAPDRTRWALKKDIGAIRLSDEGTIEITRNANLKIGRTTIQRKGGDNDRDTAKLLQFKINPAQILIV